ncbi:MAG: MBOAT family protein, partial [Christensenellaceae bacterium]|nr:MBOAT family protein [Christensenellaceae bacterium]
SVPRHIFNLAVVWLATGFWHGADWTFIAWGLLYGVLLVIEKLFLLKHLEKSKVLSRIYVLLFVVIGFVIFNADGIKGAFADIGGMFGAGGLPFISGQTLYYLKSYGLLILAAILGSMPLLKKLYAKIEDKRIMTILEPAALCAVMIVVTAYLVDGSFNPFLYFRF